MHFFTPTPASEYNPDMLRSRLSLRLSCRLSLQLSLRLLIGLALLAAGVSAASADLRQSLDRVFADRDIKDLGVLVQVLGGETLYERGADLSLMPASNMKLVTCASALRTWGDICHLPGPAYAEAFQTGLPPPDCSPDTILAMLRGMDKASDNHLADSFMRALLGTHQSPSYHDLMSSSWQHLNLPLEGCRFVDGSGLSRENRLTPRFVVSLLQHMRTESEWAGSFVHTLPVAGLDGTLKKRMKGTAAEGTVRAKTGFLTGACCLSGYVDRNGQRLVFSIMMNNHTADGDTMRAVQNRACVALAEWCQ
ncbi:MAG: D-alanyl-D-alanine carboxypeptidase/D-alanyl-D-alanine endopeptidase [Armatimonadota bacterium]